MFDFLEEAGRDLRAASYVTAADEPPAVDPRDGAQIVRLLRGGFGTRTFTDHPTRAARRAHSLAELHGTEAQRERDGSWTVDASAYYANREGA